MSPPLLNVLDRALDHTGAVLAAVPDELRSAPTPCPELTVEALAAHLVVGLAWFAGLPGGGPTDPGDVPQPRLAGRQAPGFAQRRSA